MINRKLYRPERNFGYNTSQKFCSVGVIENYGGGGGGCGKPPFFLILALIAGFILFHKNK